MKTAVYATGEVGLAITSFLGDQGNLSFLVLDEKKPEQENAALQAASGLDPSSVFWSGALYEPETIEALNAARPDLAVLAWWPYIIKPPLIEIPKLGTLNLHPSLLPYNRGKDPNFWSLVEDTPFGVTLHHVEPGIDNGDIAFQRRIEKSWTDTGASLYARAVREIVDLFVSSWPMIKTGDIPRLPQSSQEATFHRRADLEPASEIRLEQRDTARSFLNLIRARTFPPHPGAWFVDEGRRYEVRVEIRESPEP